METNKLPNYFLNKLKREGKQGKNKILILKSLLDLDKISINQICSATGLSAPTTLVLIAELIKNGWVEKKGLGTNKGGGRRPDLYGLVKDLFYVLCIDVELFMVKIAVYDNTLTPINDIYKIPYTLSKNREHFTEILDLAQKVLKSFHIPMEKLVGASLCLPGLTNPKIGDNFSYLTGSNEHKTLQEYCSHHLNMPLIIQNDVNAASLGELREGKAKNKKNALVLLMDWGVGLGIIMDGKVQEGASGYSGEIGHIPFENNGTLCYCGKRGCLETMVSGMALTKMAREGIVAGQNTILQDLADHKIEQIDPYMIVSAANKGDLFSIKLLSHLGDTMGKIISTLIQIFNPELVILEGKIAMAGEYITIPMLQSINTYCMLQIREKTEIVSSDLGEYANLIGCAAKGIAHFFTNQILNVDI
ncbi:MULTISPECIES: ROK family transcriptional regulator [Chitinophagaceae]